MPDISVGGFDTVKSGRTDDESEDERPDRELCVPNLNGNDPEDEHRD